MGADGVPPSPFTQTQPCRGATGCPLPSMARATVPMHGRTGTAPPGLELGFSSPQRGQEEQGVSLGTLMGWPSSGRRLLGADTALAGPQDQQEGAGGVVGGEGAVV